MKNEKLQTLILVIALGLALALLGGLLLPAMSAAGHLASENTDASAETAQTEMAWPEIESEQNVTNIMLVGHNYREDEPNYLSDTMILCSLNRENNVLTMVSFMRDLLVPLPAYAGHTAGRNRINVCYALGSSWKGDSTGGMEMLALCIEQNFGIHIDHTIEVSFESFPMVIDYLGGVEVELTEAEARYLTRNVGYVGQMEPGLQRLDGTQALAYARIRGIDNDMARTGRQRYLLSSLINQVRDLSWLELYELVYLVLPFVKTDMTDQDVIRYVWELAPMVKDLELDSLTCPVDNETLPGSYWAGMIDLYDVPSSVVECNFELNRGYLLDILGLD